MASKLNLTLLTLLFFAFCANYMRVDSMLCGGVQEEKRADEEINGLVNDLKSTIEMHTNNKYETLRAISYRKQIVSGINYFVKVQGVPTIGPSTYFHVRIYKPINGPIRVIAIQMDKNRDHPIEYFN